MAGLVSQLSTSRNAVKPEPFLTAQRTHPSSYNQLRLLKFSPVASLCPNATELPRRKNTAFLISGASVRTQIRKHETLRRWIGIFGWTNLRTLNTDSSEHPEKQSPPRSQRKEDNLPRQQTPQRPPKAGASGDDVCLEIGLCLPYFRQSNGVRPSTAHVGQSSSFSRKKDCIHPENCRIW